MPAGLLDKGNGCYKESPAAKGFYSPSKLASSLNIAHMEKKTAIF